MTTRELVARMAAFFHTGGPHVVWHWPLHYYLAARQEYLRIVGLVPDGGKTENANVVEIAPGVTMETIARDA